MNGYTRFRKQLQALRKKKISIVLKYAKQARRQLEQHSLKQISLLHG